MIKDSNIVIVNKRMNTSTFYSINKKDIGEPSRKIGSSQSAVGKMLGRGDELKDLMPEIIHFSNNSPSWDTSVANYWNSLSIQVPPTGLRLETGWIYDFKANAKLENIKRLVKDYPEIKDDLTLQKVLKEKVPIEQRYLYAVPIDKKEYLWYQYCLVYKDIANTIEQVDKAAHIRFYLHNEGELEKSKKETFRIKNKAGQLYYELIADRDKVDTILAIYKRFDLLKDSIEDVDKDIALEKYYKENPQEFIDILADKNLALKAKIEQFINLGIFERLDGTNIVVDALNPAVVIGNDSDATIAYFNNPANKEAISKYTSKLKGQSTKSTK